MEVELLGPRPPGLTRSQPVFALHGPNAATELGAAALLQGVQAGTLPLLPSLLLAARQRRPPGGGGSGGADDLPAGEAGGSGSMSNLSGVRSEQCMI